MSKSVRARDGLHARDQGAWGRQKLAFLENYLPPALQVTAKKMHRYYVDLFAGPGLNVERDRAGVEFDGSPIRALKLHAKGNPDLHFTHAIFVNAVKRDHDALTARVSGLVESGQSRLPMDRITLLHADANDQLPLIMRRIHPAAYAFVFADIEGLKHWPWRSVEELKRQQHSSVDLCMLFPLDMAVNRLISFKKAHTERYAHIFDAFFGTGDWRACADARITSAGSSELRHCINELYRSQLRKHWPIAFNVRDVYLAGDRRLYYLLLATKDDAAKRLGEWAKQDGQYGLGPGF